ncbi:MAG: formyltransferase family protein [Acidimicrobiia bacterium]|nr:formyltransferase family protein [Acidimicrobiia bacterium]
MNTAFFGTPEAAVASLGVLNSISDIKLVVTRIDRPRGRSGEPLPPPVKVAATELGLRVVQPDRAGEMSDQLEGIDVAVLVAYGQLISPELLAVPNLGFVNVHFSLLPRWRGAAPVERAILAGDDETGVTLMVMDEGLDTGPVLETARTPIGHSESAGELTDRLARLGADLLGGRLPDFVAGDLEASPQDGVPTEAPKIDPSEARIDPTAPADDLARQVRAFNPRPGAWGEVEGDRFKVLTVRAAEGELGAGRIEEVDGVPMLGTGTHPLELVEVQPAGKAAMEGAAWMNGRRGEPSLLS